MLDHIIISDLRLALRAFRTSPGASLYVGADGPSLYSRREKKLSLQCALAASPSNPAHEFSFPPQYIDLYKRNLNLLNHLSVEFHHF